MSYELKIISSSAGYLVRYKNKNNQFKFIVPVTKRRNLFFEEIVDVEFSDWSIPEYVIKYCLIKDHVSAREVYLLAHKKMELMEKMYEKS